MWYRSDFEDGYESNKAGEITLFVKAMDSSDILLLSDCATRKKFVFVLVYASLSLSLSLSVNMFDHQLS